MKLPNSETLKKYLNKIITFIKDALQDNSGGVSTIRICVLTWVIGVFIVWAFLSLYKMTLLPVPESVVALISVISGMKLIQRYGEKNVIETPTGTDTITTSTTIKT